MDDAPVSMDDALDSMKDAPDSVKDGIDSMKDAPDSMDAGAGHGSDAPDRVPFRVPPESPLASATAHGDTGKGRPRGTQRTGIQPVPHPSFGG